MKKLLSNKKLIISIITICIIIVICLLIIIKNSNNEYYENFLIETNSKNESFSKETTSKIEMIKEIVNSNMYFPFEDGNKKYILLGYRISSYSDPEKSNMKIIGTTYKNGNIIIELKINEVRKSK